MATCIYGSEVSELISAQNENIMSASLSIVLNSLNNEEISMKF
jgi:hypothetical protein